MVDSYGFKPNGLIKKTLKVTHKNVSHHIVSYYSLNDVKNLVVTRPAYHHVLKGLVPRPDLIHDNDKRWKAGFGDDDFSVDPFQESLQQIGIPPTIPIATPTPTPMPRPPIAHDSPPNHSSHTSSHLNQALSLSTPHHQSSHLHHPGSLSTPGHPLHQTSHTIGPLPTQYQTYPHQHVPTYSQLPQPLDFHHQEDLHASGTAESHYYLAPPTTSNQPSVPETNPNPPVLDTNSSYLYQNGTPAKMYSFHSSPVIASSPFQQQWCNSFTDNVEGPVGKRRQTVDSSLPVHAYMNGSNGSYGSDSFIVSNLDRHRLSMRFTSGDFDQNHNQGLPFFSEHLSASTVL